MTVGFEDYPYNAPASPSYAEKGLVFWTIGDSWKLEVGITNPVYATLPFPITGRQYAHFTADNTRCTNIFGRDFALRSVDVAEYSTWATFRQTVLFFGFRRDGTFVSQTFVIDGVNDGYGALQDFQRFTFRPDFTNVYHVQMDLGFCSIDNFVFDIEGTNMPPTVEITHPTNGAVFIAGTVIPFEVHCGDPDGSVVDVEFVDITNGSNSLGRAEGPPFRLTTSGLEEGTHTIQARARDNLAQATYSATITFLVKNHGAASVRIHHPMAGSRFRVGEAIPVSVRTSLPLPSLQSVAVYDAGQFLFGATNPMTSEALSFVWTNAAPGLHTLEARVFDTNQTLTTSTQVMFTIVVPNRPPTFSPGTNIVVFEDRGTLGINVFTNWATSILSGPMTEPRQLTEFDLSNDNPALFTAQPFLNPTGSLGFALTANAHGTAAVSIVLRDLGGTEFGGINSHEVRTVLISVLPVNDPPTFRRPDDVQHVEDGGEYVHPSWVGSISSGPPDEALQTLRASITNNNPALFLVPPNLSPDGTLRFVPATNANGYAEVTIQFHDDGGTERGGTSDSVVHRASLRIWPINDPPRFTGGGDAVVLEDAGLTTITNWATNIIPGPPDELPGNVTFNTSVDRPQMFSVLPTVSASGALSFRFKPNTNGSARVAVYAFDTQLSSPVTEFNLTALSVYDPPSITVAAPTNGASLTEGQHVLFAASALYIETLLTNVEFFVDGLKVGESAGSTYSTTWSNITPGFRSLSVVGTDNLGARTNSGTNLVFVNARPVAVVTNPLTFSAFAANPTIAVSATSADADGVVTQLNLFAGTRLIGATNSDNVSALWTNMSPGTYPLIAEAIDNRGATGRSSSVTAMVSRSPLQTNATIPVLVADSAIWRFSETETNVPTGWRLLEFDDSQWGEVPAEIGYGDGDEVGRVGIVRPVTTYFRQQFFVTNAAAFASLTLSLLRDDGGIVYLNDQEVFRSNMPTGVITHTTLAVATVSGTAERTFFSTNCSASRLVDGWNVLAVEIHQSTPSNADMSFDLRVLAHPAIPASGITRGTNSSINVTFSTVSNRFYTVLYSSNLLHWVAAIPMVTGTGAPFSWGDSGPPVTSAEPTNVPARFYRIQLEQ